MKTNLSAAELLALVEIVDERVERCFPRIDPPRVLIDLQQKLDAVIIRHHKELSAASVRSGKKKAAQNA
jgi:protein involved in sex pheromone biosynthesis